MREFRFLDEKRKTSGLSAPEEQRWLELAAHLGMDVGQQQQQQAGYWADDGNWYPYPEGYDPNAAWDQGQQQAYGDPQQGYPPQPGYADPNQPQYDAQQQGYPAAQWDANNPGAYTPEQQQAWQQDPNAYAAPQAGYEQQAYGYAPSAPAEQGWDPNAAGYAQQPPAEQGWDPNAGYAQQPPAAQGWDPSTGYPQQPAAAPQWDPNAGYAQQPAAAPQWDPNAGFGQHPPTPVPAANQWAQNVPVPAVKPWSPSPAAQPAPVAAAPAAVPRPRPSGPIWGKGLPRPAHAPAHAPTPAAAPAPVPAPVRAPVAAKLEEDGPLEVSDDEVMEVTDDDVTLLDPSPPAGGAQREVTAAAPLLAERPLTAGKPVVGVLPEAPLAHADPVADLRSSLLDDVAPIDAPAPAPAAAAEAKSWSTRVAVPVAVAEALAAAPTPAAAPAESGLASSGLFDDLPVEVAPTPADASTRAQTDVADEPGRSASIEAFADELTHGVAASAPHSAQLAAALGEASPLTAVAAVSMVVEEVAVEAEVATVAASPVEAEPVVEAAPVVEAVVEAEPSVVIDQVQVDPEPSPEVLHVSTQFEAVAAPAPLAEPSVMIDDVQVEPEPPAASPVPSVLVEAVQIDAEPTPTVPPQRLDLSDQVSAQPPAPSPVPSVLMGEAQIDAEPTPRVPPQRQSLFDDAPVAPLSPGPEISVLLDEVQVEAQPPRAEPSLRSSLFDDAPVQPVSPGPEPSVLIDEVQVEATVEAPMTRAEPTVLLEATVVEAGSPSPAPAEDAPWHAIPVPAPLSEAGPSPLHSEAPLLEASVEAEPGPLPPAPLGPPAPIQLFAQAAPTPRSAVVEAAPMPLVDAHAQAADFDLQVDDRALPEEEDVDLGGDPGAPVPLASAAEPTLTVEAEVDLGGDPGERVQLAATAEFLDFPAAVTASPSAASFSADPDAPVVDNTSLAMMANEPRADWGSAPVELDSDDAPVPLASNADFLGSPDLQSAGEAWQRTGPEAIAFEPEAPAPPVADVEVPPGVALGEVEEDDTDIIQGVVIDDQEEESTEVEIETSEDTSQGLPAFVPEPPAPPPVKNYFAVQPEPAAALEDFFAKPAAPAPAAVVPGPPVPAAPAAPVAHAAPAQGFAPVVIPGEHRVILHTLEGQVKRGSIRDADLAGDTIALEASAGAVPERIPRSRVKAIFFMLPPGSRPPATEGQKVRVTFRDGRQVAGFSKDHQGTGCGFFVVPADSRTNTARIFIFRHAVQNTAAD